MSNSRHDEPLIRGYAVTHPPGRAGIPVEPGWHQLLYTARGVLTVRALDVLWTVPPDKVIWIPSGRQAVIDNHRHVAVRALYVDERQMPGNDRARTMHVPAFGRALLHHIVRVAPLYSTRPVDAALATVLLDQVAQWESADLALPIPTRNPARAFADAALADPAATTDELAHRVGVSRRTLERMMRSETAISVGAWRRRARILASLTVLNDFGSVTRAAVDCGYSTPSGYVAAFAQEMGASPRRYISSGQPRS